MEPIIPVSAELVDDYRTDPQMAEFRDWFNGEMRRQLAVPFDTAVIYGV